MILNIHQAHFKTETPQRQPAWLFTSAFAPDIFNETLGDFPAVFVTKYDLCLILTLILNLY